MPDRSVTYEFKGKFDSLRSGLVTMGRGVDDFGTKLTALDKNGAKMRQGLSDLGETAGKIGLLAAGGLAAIVGVTANFDHSMSLVQAATGESADGMEKLRAAALKAGADTAFSASEAADAITALSKAGLSTSDILAGGLSGSLALAAAGELDVAQAAEIAATTMTQFGKSGADVSHIADVLAAAAGKAQGEVTDMADALNYVGPVAAQMGISLEETVGVIAELASQGILGSQAGTSLRGMLTSLTSPSKAARDEMDALGISLYDAQGNMIGFNGIAQQLKAKMSDLDKATRDQALGQIFGNEQITAARILYAGGAADVNKWTKGVNDANYATDQAATKLDNLAGDWEQLTGSIETALIGMGEGSQTPLRSLVQGLTDTVNAFSDLPGPAKNGVTAVLGLTAALGGTVFVASRVVSGMASARVSMEAMGISAERSALLVSRMSRAMGAAAGIGIFALGMSNANEKLGSFEATLGGAIAGGSVFGPWGAAIGGAAGLFASLATHADDATGEVDAFTAALDEQTGALTKNNRELAQKSLQDSGAFDAAQQLGINLALVTDAALGNKDAIAELNSEMEQYAGAVYGVTHGTASGWGDVTYDQAKAAAKLEESVGNVNGVVKESTERWQQNKEAAGGATDATQGLARADANLGNQSRLTEKDINLLVDAMEKQVKAAVAAFDAVTQWRRALKEARAQGDKTNAGIKGNSEAALKNRDALSALASAWNNQSTAVHNNTEKFHEARTAFIQTAVAMGVPEKAAKQLAATLLALPKSKVIPVSTPGATDAIRQVNGLVSALSNVHDKTAYIKTVFERHNLTINDPTHADGGFISGPGGPRDDAIPARLSNGEFVMNARATARLRPWLEMENAKGFADGGAVNAPPISLRDTRHGDDELSKHARETAQALKGLKSHLEEATKELDKETKQRDALVSKMKDLGSSVSGGLQSDLFANASPWTSGSIFSNALAGLHTDLGNESQMAKAIRTLRSKGLTGAALAYVLAQGGLSGALAFAEQPSSDIHEFARLYNRRSHEAKEIGQLAGHAAFGGALATETKELRAIKAEVAHLRHELAAAAHRNHKDHKDDQKAGKRGAGNGQRSRRRD